MIKETKAERIFRLQHTIAALQSELAFLVLGDPKEQVKMQNTCVWCDKVHPVHIMCKDVK